MKNLIVTILVVISILFVFCVLPIMIMNHDFDKVKPGEKYLYVRNSENPFKKIVIDTVYVDDVKNGWIKYHEMFRSDSDSITTRFEDACRKSVFLNFVAPDGKIK
jgi:hypothetical protein